MEILQREMYNYYAKVFLLLQYPYLCLGVCVECVCMSCVCVLCGYIHIVIWCFCLFSLIVTSLQVVTRFTVVMLPVIILQAVLIMVSVHGQFSVSVYMSMCLCVCVCVCILVCQCVRMWLCLHANLILMFTYLEKPGHTLSGGSKVHSSYSTRNNPASCSNGKHA